MRSYRRWFFAILLALLPALALAQGLLVFAAASLTDALEDIGKAYQTESGHAVTFSFASSSTLARQIEAGASVGLFISADEDWMDYLGKRQLIVPDTRTDLLGNALVLIAPANRTLPPVNIKAGFDLAA